MSVNWMRVNVTVIVHMQTAKDLQFQVTHQGLFKDRTGKDKDKYKDKDLKLVLKDTLRTRARTRINITAIRVA